MGLGKNFLKKYIAAEGNDGNNIIELHQIFKLAQQNI